LQRSPPIWLETRGEAQELNVVVDRPRGVWTVFSESTRQAQEERRPGQVFSVGPYGASLPHQEILDAVLLLKREPD